MVRKVTAVSVVTPRVLLREGIVSLLQNTAYKVVAAVSGPEELANLSYPNTLCRLALVGVDQQNGDLDQTAEKIGLLRSSMPEAKLVLLLETKSAIDLQRVLPLSPDACLVNVASRDVLLKTLELSAMGQRVFVFDEFGPMQMKEDEEIDDHASTVSPSPSYRSRLSARECDVLNWLAEGKSNKAIARMSSLSEATVKVHLKAILRKTNSVNRTQAAIWALKNGFGNASLESNRGLVPDAPTLSPAAKMQTAEYDTAPGVNNKPNVASRDDGLSPEPPSARHPGSDRPHGR